MRIIQYTYQSPISPENFLSFTFRGRGKSHIDHFFSGLSALRTFLGWTQNKYNFLFYSTIIFGESSALFLFTKLISIFLRILKILSSKTDVRKKNYVHPGGPATSGRYRYKKNT